MTKAGNRSVSEQEPKAVGEAQAVAVFHDCGHQVCKEGRGSRYQAPNLGRTGITSPGRLHIWFRLQLDRLVSRSLFAGPLPLAPLSSSCMSCSGPLRSSRMSHSGESSMVSVNLPFLQPPSECTLSTKHSPGDRRAARQLSDGGGPQRSDHAAQDVQQRH